MRTSLCLQFEPPKMAAAAIWLATIYLELPAQPSSRHRAIASSSSVGSSSGSSRNENVELVVWPMLGVEDAAVKFMAEQILEAMQADRGSQDDLALVDRVFNHPSVDGSVLKAKNRIWANVQRCIHYRQGLGRDLVVELDRVYP